MARIPAHIRAGGRTRALAAASIAALIGLSAYVSDTLQVRGEYTLEHHNAAGELLHRETFHNTVVTVGKNSLLDQYLAGSAYTAAEFMGLIQLGSYSSISAADTMASHAGWVEATSYSGNRKTCAWSSASAGAKALSAGLVFTFTGSDTIKGAFVVADSGASATVSNTGGKLLSAGLFTGGDRAVASGDTLTVSYTLSV